MSTHPSRPLPAKATPRLKLYVAAPVAAFALIAFVFAGSAVAAPPGNDDFANAQVLSGPLPITATGTNVDATKQAGEPDHAGVPGGASVWYSWTAPANQRIIVDTCRSGIDRDTLLAVYTGSTVGSLTEVASNDDACGFASRVQFLAQAGTTYRIAVDGFFGEEGNFVLNLRAAAPPANDNFANAQVLSGPLPITVTGTNVDATKQAGEPDHAGDAGGASVWYRWTAPANQRIVVDTCRSGIDRDTLLAVYTGSTVGSLTEVASNDDACRGASRVQFLAQAGTTYRIAVDGFGGEEGNFVLHLRLAAPPANDNFANAQVLSGPLPITVTGTNVDATKQAGEPDHAGDAGGASVWYSWTAPASQTIDLDTCRSGTDLDTLLAVYTGSTLGSLTRVASNDQACGNPSRVQFLAQAGTTYRIAVDGYQGEEGNFVLHLAHGFPDDFAVGGVVRQSDGKLVAAGYSADLADPSGAGGTGDFAVARYNPNGTLDTGFSGDGLQTTNFGGGDFGHALAIQPADGKIVVAGRVDAAGANNWGVARYNTNGTLDTGFSGDGKVATNFGGADSAYGVAIQPNGKIVVTGEADQSGTGDFAVARYNPNGTLDTGFSGDGKQTTNFGGQDAAFEAVIQADGKIVAGGVTNAKGPTRLGDNDFALARYNANGTLDTSYSGDGLQTTDFQNSNDLADKIAIQSDGKVVAVGLTEGRSGGDFALARYTTGGSLDASFGRRGKQTTDFGGFDDALGVAVQPDGKIVAAGVADERGAADFALARYTTGGSLDTGFSGDGTQTTDFGGFDEATGAVAIQPNGRIVAAGVAAVDHQDFALARYTAGGALDTGFSSDGLVTTNFP